MHKNYRIHYTEWSISLVSKMANFLCTVCRYTTKKCATISSWISKLTQCDKVLSLPFAKYINYFMVHSTFLGYEICGLMLELSPHAQWLMYEIPFKKILLYLGKVSLKKWEILENIPIPSTPLTNWSFRLSLSSNSHSIRQICIRCFLRS